MERISIDLDHYGKMVKCLQDINECIRDIEKQRCLHIIETYRVPAGNSQAGEIACEMTIDILKDIADQIRNG